MTKGQSSLNWVNPRNRALLERSDVEFEAREEIEGGNIIIHDKREGKQRGEQT